MQTYSPGELALVKARIAMLARYPFFGALALKLTLAEDHLLPVPMATDGTCLRFHPRLVLKDHPDELRARITACVLRCMLGHPWRRGSRDDGFWQAAGELAVTPMLVRDGFKLPTDMLYDPQYEQHSAERIYSKIYHPRHMQSQDEEEEEDTPGGKGADQEGDEKPSGEGQDAPQSGTRADDAPAPQRPQAGFREPQESQEASKPSPLMEHDWQIATLQAQMYANKRGDDVGSAEQIIKDLKTTKVPWQTITQRFVTETSKGDYDWTRPDVRYIQAGFYLPSLHAKKMGPIIVFNDYSGSTTAYIPAFGGNMQTILDSCEPEKMVVVNWDTGFCGREDFYPGDKVTIKTGTGGTNFSGSWDWLETQDDLDNIACIIFLTDLDTIFAKNPPPFPLLWAVTNCPNPTPPYGEVVIIDEF